MEACHLPGGGSGQKNKDNGFLKPVLQVCGVQIYGTTRCRNPKPRVPQEGSKCKATRDFCVCPQRITVKKIVLPP